jgi:hypothetical protein
LLAHEIGGMLPVIDPDRGKLFRRLFWCGHEPIITLSRETFMMI